MVGVGGLGSYFGGYVTMQGVLLGPIPGSPSSLIPANAYVTEDASSVYSDEDGINLYVTEA